MNGPLATRLASLARASELLRARAATGDRLTPEQQRILWTAMMLDDEARLGDRQRAAELLAESLATVSPRQQVGDLCAEVTLSPAPLRLSPS